MAAEEGTELIASGPRKRARSPDRSVPPKKRFLPNQRRYSSSSSAGSGDDIAKSDGKVRGDSPPHSADGGDEVLRLTEMALAFLHEACAQPPSPDAGQASDAPSEGSSSSPSAASSFSMGTRSGSGSGDVSSRSSSGDPDDGLDDLTLALLLDSSDGEGAAAHGASSASRSAKKSRGNKSHTTSGKAPARGGRAPSTANKPRGSCRGKTQPKVKAKIFLKTTTTDGAVTAVSLSSLVDHNLLQVGAEVFIRDCPKARAQVVPCEAPAGSKSSNQYQLKYQLDGKTVVAGPAKFCWDWGNRTKNFWLSCYVVVDGVRVPLKNLRSSLPLTNREEIQQLKLVRSELPDFAPTEWPGGVPHYDALVLGAGIAGLGCARELRRAGVTVAVLEARDRIGGRIHNEELTAGTWVKWGAQFCHGGCSDDNPLYRSMVQHGGFELFPKVVREKWMLSGRAKSDDWVREVRDVFGQILARMLEVIENGGLGAPVENGGVPAPVENGGMLPQAPVENGAVPAPANDAVPSGNGTETRDGGLPTSSSGPLPSLPTPTAEPPGPPASPVQPPVRTAYPSPDPPPGDAVEGLSGDVPIDRVWRAAKAELAKGLPPDKKEALESLFRSEIAYAAEPHHMSLRDMDEVEIIDGFDYFVAGPGFTALVNCLAQDLPIYTDCVVENVDWADSKIQIALEDGRRCTADRVVTTFPLGVLQDHLRFDLPAAAPPRSGLPPVPRSRSLFTPPLPEDKVRAIMRLGMGNEEKVVLFWPKPFWDESLMYFRHPRRHDFRVCHVYALTRKPEDRGWLTLMTPPPLSDTFGAGDDAAVVAAVMQVIGEMWRNPPPPAKSYVTKWGRDRYSRGSYSFIPVGATLGDVKKYGEPVDGRLYFAGEGTSLWDPSVAHGAYATGVFSAWDVMQALRKPLPSQGWGLRQYEERYTPHVRQLEKMKRKPSPQYVPLQVR